MVWIAGGLAKGGEFDDLVAINASFFLAYALRWSLRGLLAKPMFGVGVYSIFLVFANIVLADEINRTPPKTQAALLESMQERKVSIGGVDYPLDDPFFVLATQNPIELEGTYPLPEAQLDRFMFSIHVDYPSEAEEKEIVESTTSAYVPDLKVILTGEDIIRLQKLVRRVPVPDHVLAHAIRLARSTRPTAGSRWSGTTGGTRPVRR